MTGSDTWKDNFIEIFKLSGGFDILTSNSISVYLSNLDFDVKDVRMIMYIIGQCGPVMRKIARAGDEMEPGEIGGYVLGFADSVVGTTGIAKANVRRFLEAVAGAMVECKYGSGERPHDPQPEQPRRAATPPPEGDDGARPAQSGNSTRAPAEVPDLEKVLASQDAERILKEGLCYLRGTSNHRKDEETALRCFKAAGKLGSHDADYYLGMMYWQGRGMAEKDYEIAQLLFAKGIYAGHVMSMVAMARMDELGEGRPRSLENAYKLMSKAAVDDSRGVANYHLGRYCLSGEIDGKTDGDAYDYFWKSYRMGYPKARLQVIRMKKDGRGTDMDEEGARNMLDKAIEDHVPGADELKVELFP